MKRKVVLFVVAACCLIILNQIWHSVIEITLPAWDFPNEELISAIVIILSLMLIRVLDPEQPRSPRSKRDVQPFEGFSVTNGFTGSSFLNESNNPIEINAADEVLSSAGEEVNGRASILIH